MNATLCSCCNGSGRVAGPGEYIIEVCPECNGSGYATPVERYFLCQDQSSHWYIIPVSKREEWNTFCDIPEDDEAAWNVPEWAIATNTGPYWITFTDYRIEI